MTIRLVTSIHALALLTAIAVVARPGKAQSGTTAPSITRVQIANGSFNTPSASVNLNIIADGQPTAYRAGEMRDLSGVPWRAFTSSPAFTLSSTPGFKTVYVQVGRAAQLPTTTTVSKTTTTVTLSGSFVPAPSYVSGIAADTIVLGLPDLQSSVEMPATVRDNTSFELWVIVKNAGQITPPTEIIQFYNSFVTNSLQMERAPEVPFGVGRLVGDGCKVTDTPTVECTVAPIPPGGAVAVHLFVHANRAVPQGQTQISFTLRTRITGVRESNVANNWRDTKITILK